MNNLTDCVCNACEHQAQTTEWREECPKCHDGVMEEIWLDCECGCAYGESALEHAQERFRYEGYMASQTITQNEEWDWIWEEQIPMFSFAEDHFKPWSMWEDAWEDYAWYGTPKIVREAEPQLKFVGASEQRWCYGSDSWDWTEYYECTCGKTLHYETGT